MARTAVKLLPEDQQKNQIEEEEKYTERAPLYIPADMLEKAEQDAFDKLLCENPVLGTHFRASRAIGDSHGGNPFNNLDFLKADWKVRFIRTEMADGALVYLAVSYENGLLVEKGVVSTIRPHVRKKKWQH